MKKIVSWQCLLCIVFISLEQPSKAQSGIVPEQTAGAYCFLFSQDASSCVFGNPASHDSTAGFSMGVFSASSFLVEELNAYGLSLSKRFLKNNYFGMGYRYSGYSLYKTGNLYATFSRDFGKLFSVGLRAEQRSIRQGEGYGQINSWHLQAGTKVRLSQKLQAASLFGIDVKKRSGQETTPFHLGLKYSFSDLFAIILESAMSGSQPELRMALRYIPTPKIEFIGGIGGKPLSTSFGFKLDCSSFIISIATAYRPVFGFSPAVGLEYSDANNK